MNAKIASIGALFICALAVSLAVGQSADSVSEYEAFVQWRDQHGHRNATYEDYLRWKRGQGQYGAQTSPPPSQPPSQPPAAEPAPAPAPQPTYSQTGGRIEDRRGPQQPRFDTNVQEQHYSGYYDNFPRTIVRKCKGCPHSVTFRAVSFEYDKYSRLEEIEYEPMTCSSCGRDNELKVKLDD